MVHGAQFSSPRRREVLAQAAPRVSLADFVLPEQSRSQRGHGLTALVTGTHRRSR